LEVGLGALPEAASLAAVSSDLLPQAANERLSKIRGKVFFI